jgi:hypothetical protein
MSVYVPENSAGMGRMRELGLLFDHLDRLRTSRSNEYEKARTLKLFGHEDKAQAALYQATCLDDEIAKQAEKIKKLMEVGNQ